MCGIFGVWGHPRAAALTHLGLYSLQHRGQESAGIVAIDPDGQARSVRKMGLVSEGFTAADVAPLQGSLAIGHTRYSTAGSSTLDNAQPIVARFRDGHITLAHNGNLVNAVELRRDLEDRGSIFSSSMDSEVLVHLMARSSSAKPEHRLADAMAKVDKVLPGVAQALNQMFHDPALVDEMLAEMVPLYANNFTAAEIRELTAFYATPLGRKMMTMMPKLSAESMALSQKIVLPRIGNLMQQALQEAQKQ